MPGRNTYGEGTCPDRACRRKLHIPAGTRSFQCPACGTIVVAYWDAEDVVPKNGRRNPKQKVQRKQCPVCRKSSPIYLYASHVRQCKAEQVDRAEQVRAELARLQGKPA